MNKIKGIKGKIIVSGIGSFDEDKKVNFKKLFYQPTGFKIIEPKQTVEGITFSTKAGFLDFSKK